MNELTAIDLFCGCGGLTQGLKLAGFRVLGGVDLEKLAVESYLLNHPEVKIWNTDIRELNPVDMMRDLGLEAGELDLVAGCPPCQGFSRMRSLNGNRQVLDAQNDLVFEFMRMVRVFRPRAVMMENVPGLASDQRMADVIWELRTLGYHVGADAVQVLDARDYGVPQRRRRMILLVTRSTSVPFAPPDPVRPNVSDAIGNLPPAGSCDDILHGAPAKRSARIADLISRIPKNGGSRSDLGDEDQLACHKRCDGFKDVYGRMAWDKPAPTITTGCFNPSRGRFLHPEFDREITLREAALLQSFPSDYRFDLAHGKIAVAKMIGNALPPEFVRRHAEHLAHHLMTGGESGSRNGNSRI